MPINPVSLDPNHDTDGDEPGGTDPTGNHDTDRLDPFCSCGHAKSDHEPLKRPDVAQTTWQCLYCACTRAYPVAASASH